MESKDIKEIILLIKEKNSLGFDLLYRHYFRFLFSVAYSVLNNEDDSYDVIQSVMLRLYMLDEKLFPSEHEMGWLKTVVKNEALMKLRKEKATVPLENVAELPTQDQKIDDFVDMEQFNALAATLNERQRKVVTMKIMGDMTHKEIARILSIPIGTVQWLYSTSIKKLQRAMTALAAFALLCGSGLIYQALQYFTSGAGETPGDVGISSIPPAEPVMSPWLPVSAGLFLLSIIALFLFFKFSDKFPTNRLVKRI